GGVARGGWLQDGVVTVEVDAVLGYLQVLVVGARLHVDAGAGRGGVDGGLDRLTRSYGGLVLIAPARDGAPGCLRGCVGPAAPAVLVPAGTAHAACLPSRGLDARAEGTTASATAVGRAPALPAP